MKFRTVQMNWLKMLSCWKDKICKDRQSLY